MAANRALAENNHIARQNIRTFNRDADRYVLISTPQIISWADTNALAAMDIHRVINCLAPPFGQMVFDNRRDDRRFFAQIDRAGCHHPRGVHHVSIATDARQRFFDAFKKANRCFELRAHPAVSATGARRQFGGSHAGGWQGNGSPCRQTIHQHAPALPNPFLPANHPIHRNEHILTRIRAILECRIQCIMTPPDVYSRGFGRNQCQSNTEIFVSTQQSIGIIQFESKPQDGRNRTQGDIAFFPGEPHAQDIAFAFKFAPAHNPEIRHGAGIRPGFRRSQGKAWHFQSFGQPRQIIFFLLLSTIMQQ